MSRSVGILGTEGRTESINGSKSCCSQFALKLSAHGKRCLLTEEIIIIDYLALIILLKVIQVLGGHLEHVTCSLTVTGCDKRCMEIVESMLMEIGMNSHSHIVADTHHGSESIGAQAHVGMLAHILEGLPLLLHGIVITAQAQHLNIGSLHLYSLT